MNTDNTANANDNGNANNHGKDVISPHKTVRTGTRDDTSKHLPSLRSDRERPSPGPNRKISGSGAPKRARGPDGIDATDIFASAQNGGAFTLGIIRGSPAKTGRSQSESPTPSRRIRELDTGHHATDVEPSDLEEGQIPENTPTPVTTQNRESSVQITGYVPAPTSNEVQITRYVPAPTVAATAYDVDDAAQEADDEGDGSAPMAIDADDDDGINAMLDSDEDGILATAVQQAQASRAATPMEGHTFVFDNRHQAAEHLVQVVGDVAEGQVPPYPIPAPAAAHPIVEANANPAPEQPAPHFVNPFVFADPQQAQAAAFDRNAAPMFVFGTRDGTPMPVVADPNVHVYHEGVEMQGIYPAIPDEIPNDARAVQGVLLDGPQGPAVVFIFPDIKLHAAEPPTDAHLNPHHKLAAAEPEDPTGPADVGKAKKVQPNSGDFDTLVISEDQVFENVHKDDVDLIKREPDVHGIGVLANGGEYFNTHLGKVLVKELEDSLTPEFGTGQDRFIFPVSAADPNYRRNGGQVSRYAPPFIFGVRFSNPDLLAKFCEQRQFGINRTYSFYFLTPKDLAVSWTGAAYSVSVGGGTDAARVALRGALSQFLWTDPGFGRALAKYQHPGEAGSLDERRYKVSQSIDPRWDPHMEAYIVFIKPCTASAAHWEAVTDTFAGQPLRDGYFKFTPVFDPAAKRVGPRCVLCKGSEHFASTCPFTRDPMWWGPQSQISGITEGPLAPSNGGSSSNGGTRGGRGGTRGGRGRGGRGGRGRGRGN